LRIVEGFFEDCPVMGEKEPAVTPSPTEELAALELARCRLEAVLASDENWRALRQAGIEVDPANRAARQARNTRLEMALVGNAHYQAWKHLNGAITALRARNVGQASHSQDTVQPMPMQPAGTRGPMPGPAASVSPTAPQRLAERLGQLEGPQIEAIALPGETPGRSLGALIGKGHAPGVRRDPPEASVTFVVREVQAPSTQPGEVAGEAMAEHIEARLERLRNFEARQMTASSQAGGGTDVEAEVTIISAEGRRQQREAEARAGHVRRFRRALSGD
jgi:hypothetical protein